jgi:hypothetical protein
MAKYTTIATTKPWRTETFKFSTDPELEAKVRDIVGLYLQPLAEAVVLCVDQKSQIQALDRPRRSCRCGRPCRRRPVPTTSGTSTTTLFAAPKVAIGKVDACYDRHLR